MTIYSNALEIMGTASFVLNPDGVLLHANSFGEALLGAGDVVHLSRGRKVAPRDQEAAARWDRSFEDAKQDGRRVPAAVRLRSAKDEALYLGWMVPIQSRLDLAASAGLIPVDAPTSRAAVLVLITCTPAEGAPPPDVLVAIFGVTKAEAQLLSALVVGDTLADYAARTGHSRNTLRNQLASIFDKTGTRRQAELVAVVLKSIGTIARPGSV